jgi:hypothetical protein
MPEAQEVLMAEMTIRLRCDPATGKKDIIVSLRSDEDTLPHEHEQQHRALVDKLIDRGLLKASELGQIVIERESEPKQPATGHGQTPQQERRSAAEGQ